MNTDLATVIQYLAILVRRLGGKVTLDAEELAATSSAAVIADLDIDKQAINLIYSPSNTTVYFVKPVGAPAACPPHKDEEDEKELEIPLMRAKGSPAGTSKAWNDGTLAKLEVEVTKERGLREVRQDLHQQQVAESKRIKNAN